jgi:hypothetical protein
MKKQNILAFISLLFALMVSALSVASAEQINNTSNDETIWDGVYATNMMDSESQGQWASPNTLSVAWGRDVQYGGSPIKGTKFFNNSSILWTEDPILGTGQIWFTSGDNRSFYWPDGAVAGRVFTGKIQAISGKTIDFRGINDTIYSNDQKDQIGCVGASCPAGTNSCGPCSNGKVCSNGQCVCPSGTTDCFGQCLAEAPCGGSCADGKECINGKCICPNGTKECNNRCIKVTECCDGCPPWKVCSNGVCACPPGIKDCPDPLPL